MDRAMLNRPDQEQGDILVMDGDDIQKHYLWAFNDLCAFVLFY